MSGDWGTTLELFGLSVACAMIAGAVVPLVGCFLFVRRTSFHGVVLPQFAAAGVSCSYAALPYWNAAFGLGAPADGSFDYRVAWAGLFTFGGLGLLVLAGRGRSEVGLLAAAFAVAAAATVLLAHASPTGELLVSNLMRGELLLVGAAELRTLGVGLGIVVLFLAWLHRDFTLVCYDPENARVLGKPVRGLELLLHALTGLTVTAGVLTVGPMVLFGLLVLPPIAARAWARSMGAFLAVASAVGVATTAVGVWASFRFDAPLGPCLVLGAGAALVPAAARTAARTATP